MSSRLVVFLGLLLVGCGSTSQTHVPVGSTTTRSTDLIGAEGTSHVQLTSIGAGAVMVDAPVAQVWAALPQVYEELGLQGRPLNAAQRLYGQPETTVRRRLAGAAVSRYLDCGSRAGIANADSYNVTLTIATQVRAQGEEASELRTEIQATARAVGNSDPAVRCGSTNVLERRIEELVGRRVAAPSR